MPRQWAGRRRSVPDRGKYFCRITLRYRPDWHWIPLTILSERGDTFLLSGMKDLGGGEIKHDDVQSTPSSGFSSIIAVHLDGMLLRYREKFTMCEFWGLSRAAAENSDAASWRILLGHFDLRRWGHYVVSKRRHPITHWRCFISQNHHCAPCLVNLLRVS